MTEKLGKMHLSPALTPPTCPLLLARVYFYNDTILHPNSDSWGSPLPPPVSSASFVEIMQHVALIQLRSEPNIVSTLYNI